MKDEDRVDVFSYINRHFDKAIKAAGKNLPDRILPNICDVCGRHLLTEKERELGLCCWCAMERGQS